MDDRTGSAYRGWRGWYEGHLSGGLCWRRGAWLLTALAGLCLGGCSDDGMASSNSGGAGGSGGAQASGGAGGSGGSGGSVDVKAGGPVVDAAWLLQRIEHPEIQVIDTRADGFAAGHIAGARTLMPLQLAGTVDGVSLQLLPAADGQAALRAQGISADTIAVVYGEPPEYDPARVFWALSAYGHADVRYLDGGWAAWQAAGGPTASGAAEGTSDYTIDTPNDALRVSGQWVLEQLGPAPYDTPAIQLVDVRSGAEYAAGHIPTAIHIDWGQNLDNDGLLLPGGQLDALYGQLDKSVTTVTYCLVGWRASVTWLALTAAGFEDVRVYDGSWTEWGAGGFPVE